MMPHSCIFVYTDIGSVNALNHRISLWSCLSADLVIRYSSLLETVCGPELSLIPYISIRGMFRLMKYSNVSLVMGAAPVKQILQRSNPRMARTFLKTRLLARPKPHGTLFCLQPKRKSYNMCFSLFSNTFYKKDN